MPLSYKKRLCSIHAYMCSMSPVVGVILMLAIEFVGAGLYIAEVADWGGRPQVTHAEAATLCRCEPPTNVDGSVCQPISLPSKLGVAGWNCEVKPSLMHGEI